MSTLLPQPIVPATTNPEYDSAEAAFYLIAGPTQVPAHRAHHRQVTDPGITSLPLAPSHPISSQPSLHPAFPLPPGQADQRVTIQVVSSLSRPRRNLPHTGSTLSRSPSLYSHTTHPPPHPSFPMAPEQEVLRQLSPSYHLPEQDAPYSQSHLGASGADQFTPTYQRYPEDSDSQLSYEGHEASAMNNGHRLAKGPPTRPFYTGGPPSNNNKPNKGFLSSLFGKTTADHPVQDPELQFYACRWPGCEVPVRSDQVGNLGGFCCTTQMWDAIYNGMAKQCGCKRVCPQGQDYCSARCANGVTVS